MIFSTVFPFLYPPRKNHYILEREKYALYLICSWSLLYFFNFNYRPWTCRYIVVSCSLVCISLLHMVSTDVSLTSCLRAPTLKPVSIVMVLLLCRMNLLVLFVFLYSSSVLGVALLVLREWEPSSPVTSTMFASYSEFVYVASHKADEKEKTYTQKL